MFHVLVRRMDTQMMACGPLARDVPRRNLRSASLVSWEKEYSLDSEACGGVSIW